jgi:hypothetical protein
MTVSTKLVAKIAGETSNEAMAIQDADVRENARRVVTRWEA